MKTIRTRKAYRTFTRVPGAAALGAIAALVGCGDADVPVDPVPSGIHVEVVRGPIQPVEQPGVDNTAPVAGAVVSAQSVAGGAPRVGETDAEGLVRIHLGPGDYTVVVLSCPGALRLPADVEIGVTPATFTDVRLECDTGIR